MGGHPQGEGGEETLGMTRRLEAAHRSFTLTSRLVRILCPIVQAPVAAMFDARHDFVMGGFIAPELHPSGVPLKGRYD